MMEVLLDMGFSEADVEAALARHSSMDAAVEYLMLHGAGPGDPVERTDSGSFAQHLDHIGQIALAQLPLPHWLLAGVDADTPSESVTTENTYTAAEASVMGATSDVADALRALGFTESQVQAAVRRCSSVEAAVEWLSMHPAD